MATGPSFTPEEIAEAVAVPKAKLDQECSEEHVKKISLFLESWGVLAPHLNLKKTDIEDIDQEGRTEQEKRLKTLQKWKEKFIFLATYKGLMEALLKIGKADHARQVCRLLLSHAIESSTTGHIELGGAGTGAAVITTPIPCSSNNTSLHERPHSQVTSSLPKSMEEEIHELEEEFDGLVNRTADDIENAIENGKIKLSRVKRSVTLLPVSLRYLHIKFLQGKLSAINKAEDINAIFLILGSYWDFMNCGLLEHLVNRFGSKETQLLMGRYLKRLKEFRIRTTVREFTDKWTGDIPSNLADFVLEMGEEWMDRSLEAVEELRTRLSRQCSFNEYALPLKRGSHNSVILCFALQCSFPMSTEIIQPARQLLQEQGVQRVFFKGVCLLDLRPFHDIHVPLVELVALPSMEGATGGGVISINREAEYESQSFIDHEHISSEEDKEMEDQLQQNHKQQGHGSPQGIRERCSPEWQHYQEEMRQYQRREKELLQELQDPKAKHQKTKHKNIADVFTAEAEVETQIGTSAVTTPLEGLDYHPKYGTKLDESGCLMIVSVGSEHPTNVRVEPKVEDEARARQAVNAHGRLPDIVGLPLGTEVDLNVISGHIRTDPRRELIDLQLDITGYQRSRDYYLQAIRNFFTQCKQPGATIWYTGHREEGTGNWCFKDGTISFQEVFNLYREHFSGRLLSIVSDCCYSGHWVEACAERLDNLGIPPCGHKAREYGVLIKVVTSCQSHQKAGDPCYSLEGVWLDNEDKCLTLWRNKQLSESQTTLVGDFTRLVCLRDPDGPCRAGNFKNWMWKDAVSGKMGQAIYSVQCADRGRPVWHCVLLSNGGEEHESAFLAQHRTGTVNVADWGIILLSGWGEEIPHDVEEKIYNWTWVS